MNLQKAYIELSNNPLINKDELERVMISDRLTSTDFKHKLHSFNKEVNILLADIEKNEKVLRSNFFDIEDSKWSNKAKYDYVIDIESTSLERFAKSYAKQINELERKYFSYIKDNCLFYPRLGIGSFNAQELANTLLQMNAEYKDKDFLDKVEFYLNEHCYESFLPTCSGYNYSEMSSGKGINFNGVPVYYSRHISSDRGFFKIKSQNLLECVDVIGLNTKTNMIACRIGIKFKTAKTQVLNLKVGY